ncbi:MAG: Lrp/AsnC family transcriptional regulator [Gammaproteobacteria bacterium]|nr:MAG: Lrp/AsnC family transcriptional regulator [Gammaproteobacteria bacterium]
MHLDKFNIKILNVLQQNGRISKRDLADEIGLSDSPCWVRLRKLEELGYIQGYQAKINFERIGRFCHVTTLVRLGTHQAQDFSKFEEVIQSIPEIVDCESVVGEIDYILSFVTVDIDHYQRLIEDLLAREIGILAYFSHVRSKSIKEGSNNLLEHLLDTAAKFDESAGRPTRDL